jgi:hypothetical protein
MSRIIKLEATISVEDDTEIGEVSMPFSEFIQHTLPELMEHNEEYRVLDSDVDTLFDN